MSTASTSTAGLRAPGWAAVLLLLCPGAVLAQAPPPAATGEVPAEPSEIVRARLTDGATGEPLGYATVSQGGQPPYATSDATGRFTLALDPDGPRAVRIELLGYAAVELPAAEVRGVIALAPTAVDLGEATVTDRARDVLAAATLRDVDGVAIYAGRKSDLIVPDRLLANLATNNPRELFRTVAGLTVWESDGAGLQLSIAARGLSPNRSSNFNTRQNGFDISADALGYPEAYYTPPAQALARVELVRGAASLQYGTQFGGLLNFKLKEGPADRELAVVSEQTVGSYGLFTSFNSVGGTVGKVSYYGFGQFKRGDGWRDNAGFRQGTGYLDVHVDVAPRLRVGLELTRMGYTAQQPGGLLDFEFDRDPRASKRARNHFRVDWGLAALHVDYELSPRARLNVRTFVLDAGREALGELGPINRPDPLRERDLVVGAYRNFGQEARLLHRYDLGGRPATLVVGTRLYSGLTQNRQGLGPDGAGPGFRFLHPAELETSDYDFPSRNYAAFAEHVVPLGERWALTPGLRLEHILTTAEGYYRRRVTAGGEVLLDERVESTERNARSFLLGGLGASYRAGERLEAYANASQNYRAINFADLAVVNPNLLIDSALADERGYNLELGLRGTEPRGRWRYDVSAFYLRYANRIGVREVLVPDTVLVEREVSLRTNIGRADLVGLEAYGEADVAPWVGLDAGRWSLRPSVNASLIRGRYRSGGAAVEGRAVEYAPPLTLRLGVAARRGPWSAQVLATHVREHYSDATNAELVADATRGLIPTYTVLDANLGYTHAWLRVQVGANNLADARYFTRRATGYPGPGILPAEARGLYASARVSL